MNIRIVKVRISRNGEKIVNKDVDKVVDFSELESIRESFKTKKDITVNFEYEEIQDSERNMQQMFYEN